MAARAAVQKIDPALFPLLLYKRILRLHYGLPAPARLMGDSYVKDEFRRHKSVPREQALVFLNEWTQYCTMLSKQLTGRGISKGVIGKDFDHTDLDKFSEEQLSQLLELKEEAELDQRRLRGETVEVKKESEV
ncbi:hypothetical protein PRIPAC_74256 [Pristionchus pacificus]|uniref:Succinate dehydrogenase assembly factor 3 n=1 Tax=Pristionchus pacificus TaxID=54126 RepID=A0A8R1U9E3_PRIPA|nr:hypothetical protein PRIPAC_74256 [Pristionchus pacificus]|eukprot:PDM81214.1 hypothetical protein PRIPAC_36217 [Pristionchus pacificus]